MSYRTPIYPPIRASELVKLRLIELKATPVDRPCGAWWADMEIEALLAETATIRAALEGLLNSQTWYGGGRVHNISIGAWERAKQALANEIH